MAVATKESQTMPRPKPIPGGVGDPLVWRYHLQELMNLFHDKSDAPEWLVDAFFDATFDPRVQQVLTRFDGKERP